ncbi:hypothetical protein [Nannocystis pusilla]|uniref:hypothetical protein n=1 Tax=Nannocystis pusilla TaxID=889268 RepID=UPI003B79186E
MMAVWDARPVERAGFERRFAQAAAQARDFAREFVAERLPDAMIFRVQLNGSYDLHAGPELRLFPQDSQGAGDRAWTGITGEQVVELLWRDGYVPQWVDVAVVGETGEATVIEVLACGRFIDDEAELYYDWTEVAPFGVKGPVLPIDYVQGRRFSLYVRSSCDSLAELDRARQNAAKVWSLRLRGPAFTDAVLGAGLEFPGCRSSSWRACPWRARGWQAWRGSPYHPPPGAARPRERLDLTALPGSRWRRSRDGSCRPS